MFSPHDEGKVITFLFSAIYVYLKNMYVSNVSLLP